MIESKLIESKPMERNVSGFTLVELLMTIAIIGILASIVLISMNNAKVRALMQANLASAKSFSDALYAGCVVGEGHLPVLTDTDIVSGASLCGFEIPQFQDGGTVFVLSSNVVQLMIRIGTASNYSLCAFADPSASNEDTGLPSIVTVCPVPGDPTNCITTPDDGVTCKSFHQ
jgi:prepilin-type N-terminal cleavage/methylation domain-containing protein